MSGIALASVKMNEIPTRGTDTRWKKALGMIPTTVRAFAADDELRVFVEIYDNEQRGDHQTLVSTTVRAASGKTVLNRHQTLARTREQSTYPIVTSIPLANMPPDEYVLCVTAANTAMPNQPVTREIPFSIRTVPTLMRDE
jgi:hypothetical protein